MKPGLQAILFDLDGTLVDTAPDIADALNHTLAANNRPRLPFATIRPKVSLGAAAMLELAFAIRQSDPEFDRLRQQFLQCYQDNLAVHSAPFPGMDRVLKRITANDMKWGIVTNKPGWLTGPLLTALGLDKRTPCIVSGDTLTVCKPDPAPLLHACQLLQCDPAKTLYVGDAERDIQAGRGAGMKTLVAAYGYLGADDKPLEWGADGIINRPTQVLDWLDQAT